MRDNRGFSLVEVMVAMMILVIGVLGLAGSSAAIARMASDGNRYGEAAAVVGSVVDSLRATPCASFADGSTTRDAYSVSIAIVQNADFVLLRDVTMVLRYNSKGGVRVSTWETRISCAPSAS
jgi:prepilin-type N-terminal cleavage/methylation domain-containing protein